jgi:hypothetical protein
MLLNNLNKMIILKKGQSTKCNKPNIFKNWEFRLYKLFIVKSHWSIIEILQVIYAKWVDKLHRNASWMLLLYCILFFTVFLLPLEDFDMGKMYPIIFV